MRDFHPQAWGLKVHARSTAPDPIRQPGKTSCLLLLAICLLPLSSHADPSLPPADEAVSRSAEAAREEVTGILGSEGPDDLENSAGLDLEADAMATSTGLVPIGEDDASAAAEAVVTGVDGLGGDDGVASVALLHAEAHASAFVVDLDIGPHGSLLLDASATADSTATGLEGGSGGDVLTNAEALDTTAHSIATTAGAGLEVNATDDVDLDASSQATARAEGLSGGDGSDDFNLTNQGEVDFQAISEASGAAVSLSVSGNIDGDGTGGALSDASATADASGTGIQGGTEDDFVTNEAAITGSANATATMAAVSAEIALEQGGRVSGLALSDASASATAAASGIDGGAGVSDIDNGGDIALDVDAGATAVGVSLTVAGTAGGGAAGEALSDTSATADATASGIISDAEADEIENGGRIQADAAASADAVAVAADVALEVSQSDEVMGATLSDTSATARSATTGIDAGAGDDWIVNDGAIALMEGDETDADALGVAVSLTVAGVVDNADDSDEDGDGEIAPGDGASVMGLALSDSSATAEATATGIDAGLGWDDIDNTGGISADLRSNADAVDVSLNVSGTVGVEGGTVTGAALSDASATARAAATGIDAGGDEQRDEVWNDGSIDLDTDANALGVAVSLSVAGSVQAGGSEDEEPQAEQEGNGDGTGSVAAMALSDASATADASSTGIITGAGADEIENLARIDADADADADAVAVSLDVTLEVGEGGEITGATLSDASATARSAATGIDAGAGDDWIVNEGAIVLMEGDETDADALGVAISLTLAGVVNNADESGNGDGEPAADGEAPASGASVMGLALSDSSATAEATATGIDAGLGRNDVDNAGEIFADVRSNADAVDVALGVSGTIGVEGGTVTGAALSDASVTAEAEATGISTGGGGDEIENLAGIAADAASSADAVAVAVDVAVKVDEPGVVEGAGLSDASATARSTTTGIDAGAGDDWIQNEGAIELMQGVGTDADADAVAVAVSLAGRVVRKGEDGASEIAATALSDASSRAEATATGIAADSGADRIDNEGVISADLRSQADSDAVSVDVAVSVSSKGSAQVDIEGTALSDASARGMATLIGIDAGAGDDRIFNEGDFGPFSAEAEAKADAVSVDIAGDISFKGVTTGEVSGQALSDSGAEATASTSGIDAGAGDDWLVNEGDLGSELAPLRAHADAEALSVAVNLSGEVPIKSVGIVDVQGAALSDTSATGLATATGLDGGAGDDRIVNEADQIVLEADAAGDALAVSVDIAGTMGGDAEGLARSQASGSAKATGTGISAGAGADRLYNEAMVDARADSLASSRAASADVTVRAGLEGKASGGALSDSSANGVATAVDLSGGSGADVIENKGELIADADAEAESLAVSVSIGVGTSGVFEGDVGAEAASRAGSTATATAAGIDAGRGGDLVVNRGAIRLMEEAAEEEEDCKADACAKSTSVSAGVGVNIGAGGESSNAALSDSSAVARALSTGIDAGEGNDQILNEGVIELMGEDLLNADADALAVGVTIGVSAGPPTGSARASGLALSNSSALADAAGTGIAGGAGVDRITNRAAIRGDVGSRAKGTAGSGGLQISVTGTAEAAALADASATGLAAATGIAGGADADRIANAAAIRMRSRSEAGADTYSVQATLSAGGVSASEAVANASAEARSRSTGLEGGEGDDQILHTGTEIDADAQSVAAAKSVAVQGGLMIGLADGAAVANSSATARSSAVGIAGDDNDPSEASEGSEGETTQFTDQRRAGEDPDAIVGQQVHFGTGESAGFVSVVEAFDWETGTFTLRDALPEGGVGSGDEYELGRGSDRITNSGTIGATSLADATASSTSVSAGLSVGASGAVSLGDASSTARADATGIAGGADADRIVNRGEIRAGAARGEDDLPESSMAVARAASISVGVGVGIGVSSREASASSSANATATAAGIRGGSGDDELYNFAALRVGTDPDAATGDEPAMALALAASESVGVTVGLGASSTATSSDAAATAEAISTGIEGDVGDDRIDNTARIDVVSTARSVGIGESTTVTVTFGASDASASSAAFTLADASATGIDGGAGEDRLTTSGELTVRALPTSTAEAGSTAVNALSIGAAGQSGKADSSATAHAAARGVAGGTGADRIVAAGTLDIASDSEVAAETRSAAVTGFALGAVSSQSEAGAATTSDALAVAIDGGDGDDEISNRARIAVAANARGDATSASATSTGFSLAGASFGAAAADASTSVDAAGIGIAGGEGFDVIANDAAIAVHSDVDSTATSQASFSGEVLFGAVSGKAASNAGATLTASATGIDAGEEGSEITSGGSIAALAASHGDVTSTSKADAKATFGSASTSTAAAARAEAAADAAGIVAGLGKDVVANSDSIGATAESTLEFTVHSVSTSKVTFGSGFAGAAADASSQAGAKARGIEVGESDDQISNSGAVGASASASSTVAMRTLAICKNSTIFGSCDTNADSTAAAEAAADAQGLDAGEGADTVSNAGAVAAAAESEVALSTTTVSSDGSAALDARTLATAQAVGIGTAGGDDLVSNRASLLASAAPRVRSSNRVFGDRVDGRLGVELTADATGISAGAGDDVVDNDGEILVLVGSQADSTLAADAERGSRRFKDAGETPDELVGKWVRFRARDPEAGDAAPRLEPDFFTMVEAFVEESDELVLRDPLPFDLAADSAYTIFDVESDAADIVQSVLTSAGSAFVDASTAASVRAAGILGGDGDDVVDSSADVRVHASNAVEAGTLIVSAAAEADLRTKSEVEAVGLSGDDPVAVSTSSEAAAAGAATFTDASRIGDDPISIVGRRILFETGPAAGFSTTVDAFDAETGELTLMAALPGTGLQAGDHYALGGGYDVVLNSHHAVVEADSAVDFSAAELSFFGVSANTRGLARAATAGVSGGAFSDLLENRGSLESTSRASITAEEKASAVFGGVEQALSFAAESEALGMSAGDGDDVVTSAEGALVDADAVSTAAILGSTRTAGPFFLFGFLQQRTRNVVEANVDSLAVGLELGSGDDWVDNAGELWVTSYSVPAGDDEAVPEDCPPKFCVARAQSEGPETGASAIATTDARAFGIRATAGKNQALNRGPLLDVDAVSVSTSFAKANEILRAEDRSTIDSRDGTTFRDSAVVGVESFEYVGKKLRLPGRPDLDFVADVIAFDPAAGEFTLSEELPDEVVVGDAYTFSLVSEDAPAGSNSFTDATRIGEDLPELQNSWVTFDEAPGEQFFVESFNPATGEFQLLIQPGQELPELSAEDIYGLSTRRNGTSGSTATATAVGIELGNGNAVVDNESEIDVTASATALTEVQASRGITNAAAEAVAEAVGIRTRDGDDSIRNSGSITAAATVQAESSTGVVSEVARATGIDTGNGDDVLVNAGSGSITASEGGVPGSGVAIRVGAGKDRVALQDDSSVSGAIDLGADDDLLTLAGRATAEGVVDGGAGADTVRLEDRGRFVLQGIVANEHYQVDQGVLQTLSGASVLADGSFRAEIYDGGFGQLLIEGTALLDGEATPIALPRAYVDGDAFPLLSALDIQNAFAVVSLPPDSALVGFDSRYRFDVAGRDLFEVTVEVESFGVVAQQRLQRAVARYLDEITPTASGDLAEVVGTFQLLPPDADFATAFNSLSPDQYDGSTLTGIDTQRQYLRSVERRLDTVRARRTLGVEPEVLASLQLAMVGSSADILGVAGAVGPAAGGETPSRTTLWLDGLGQFGDQDPGGGFSGFDYRMGGGAVGVDHAFGRRFVAGANAGYSYSAVDFDGSRGRADIDAVHGSLYGTWLSERAFLDGVLSYARQSYDNRRSVVVGGLQRSTRSDHDANVFGARLAGGYEFAAAGFGLRPFGALSYVLLAEEGFREKGALSANLVVDDRTTNSLVSELGLRVARSFRPELGTFVPYLSAAWKYDFDVDDRRIVSGLAGAPGTSFPVSGRHIDQNGAMAGAGLLYLRKGWSASVEYLGEFRGDYTANGIFARLGFSF